MGGILSIAIPVLAQNFDNRWISMKTRASTCWETMLHGFRSIADFIIYGRSKKETIPAYLEVDSHVEVVLDSGHSFRDADVLLYQPSRGQAVVQFNLDSGVIDTDEGGLQREKQLEITVVKCRDIRQRPDMEEIKFCSDDWECVVDVLENNIWRVGAIVSPPIVPEEDTYKVLVFSSDDEDHLILVPLAKIRKHTEFDGISSPALKEGFVGLVGGFKAEITCVLGTYRLEVVFPQLRNSMDEALKQVIRTEEWHNSQCSYLWDKFVWSPLFKSPNRRNNRRTGTTLDDYDSYLPAYASICLLQIVVPFFFGAASSNVWSTNKQMNTLYSLTGISVSLGTLVVARMLHSRLTKHADVIKWKSVSLLVTLFGLVAMIWHCVLVYKQRTSDTKAHI